MNQITRESEHGVMSEAEHEYDLVVIGGGPAGVIAATTAAAANKKTALVDCYHELGARA